MSQQQPPPFRAQTGDLGQNGLEGLLPGFFAVITDGKTVRFISKAHEQQQGRGLGRRKQGVFPARQVKPVPDRLAAGQDPGLGQSDNRQFAGQIKSSKVLQTTASCPRPPSMTSRSGREASGAPNCRRMISASMAGSF